MANLGRFVSLILLVTLFISMRTFGWEDPLEFSELSQEDTLCVSLGSHCEIAIILRELGIRTAAYPFDWLVSINSEGICTALDEDFRDFISKIHLFHHPDYPEIIENSKYKCELRHEGNILEDENLFQKIHAKYERRINRFRQIRKFCKKVYFFRGGYDLPYGGPNYWVQEGETAITFAQAKELQQCLSRYFPGVDYTLFILNYIEETPSPMNPLHHVREFRISKSNRHNDYRKIFQELNLLP